VALTEAAIEAELIALDAERAAITARMLDLNVQLSDARARAALENMGDGERAAILRVAGIPSAEAVQ